MPSVCPPGWGSLKYKVKSLKLYVYPKRKKYLLQYMEFSGAFAAGPRKGLLTGVVRCRRR